ncbi:unnamed protein product, partial [Ectocarpus sp. 12 AP-2014]
MNGPKWRKWRGESGQAFKEVLCDRVENVSPLAKRSKPSHWNRRWNKALQSSKLIRNACVLQMMFRSINIDGSVRTDEPT